MNTKEQLVHTVKEWMQIEQEILNSNCKRKYTNLRNKS
jgi:hypothetical protein